MDKFMAINAFVRVAEDKGFTAAAKKLGVSVSAVTKSVARLEQDLGAQLFNRTTRRIALTDYGQEFYDRCAPLLTALEEAETTVRESNAVPRGRVRAVMPNSFGRVTVAPALPIFLERYPDVVLELQFSDSPIGFIEEGIDLAVRTGELSDSRLVKRLLTQGSQVTVAAPSYLARHGTPKKPQDLHDHNCVISRFGPEWTFKEKNGKDLSVRVAGNLMVLNGDVMREAVVAGAGVAQATWWLFRKDLEAGRVVEILPDYTKRGSPVSVLYPANRHLPAKVRVFIDFLVEITKRG
jgi:DNA-binding transcriptional LysR family regulator